MTRHREARGLLFTAQITNPNTRRAYARAATEFFDWLEARGVPRITAVESVHVAAYSKQLPTPTAKLRARPAARDACPSACVVTRLQLLHRRRREVGSQIGTSPKNCGAKQRLADGRL